MRRFLVGLLAVIGLIAIILVGLTVGGAWWLLRAWREGPPLPDRFVLVADLRGSLAEQLGTPILSPLPLEARPTASDVIRALDEAAADPRVAGVAALLDDTAHGMAVAQELAASVRRLRATGRFTLAYADTFGELTSGTEGYLIASSFDEIVLQPVGLVGLNGLAVEMPFLTRLLEDLGVRVQIGKRRDYKTALDNFAEPDLTAENREMLSALLDSYLLQLTAALGEHRDLEPARAQELLTGGPYTAEEALALGLVDRLGHRDEALDAVKARVRARDTVDLRDYIARLRGPEEPAATVAFVRAAGPIQRGGSELGGVIAADEVAGALADAIAAADVRAILLRVSSPGGSAVASETIARQVRRAIAAGKPVVVSMGNVAASGGYWIAMDASRIVAQPATLTGSIGVIAGKPVLAELWDKLDVNWAALTRGPNADMWSINRPFDEGEWARLDDILDELYAGFKARVAEGRGLSLEQVEAVAKGRVWTGAQALERGLVDRMGGIHEALDEIRDLLGLPRDAALAVEPFPAVEPPLARLLGFIMRRLEALASWSSQLEAVLGPSTARMPPVVVR